jgi:predicted nucleic acid-binding Zn ribbon protein
MIKKVNLCLSCGKETKNKEFCSAKCRGMFNRNYAENNSRYTKQRSGVNRKESRA